MRCKTTGGRVNKTTPENDKPLMEAEYKRPTFHASMSIASKNSASLFIVFNELGVLQHTDRLDSVFLLLLVLVASCRRAVSSISLTDVHFSTRRHAKTSPATGQKTGHAKEGNKRFEMVSQKEGIS